MTWNFRTLFQNNRPVVNNAEASIDDRFGGFELVQLIGKQKVAFLL